MLQTNKTKNLTSQDQSKRHHHQQQKHPKPTTMLYRTRTLDVYVSVQFSFETRLEYFSCNEWFYDAVAGDTVVDPSDSTDSENYVKQSVYD